MKERRERNGSKFTSKSIVSRECTYYRTRKLMKLQKSKFGLLADGHITPKSDKRAS